MGQHTIYLDRLGEIAWKDMKRQLGEDETISAFVRDAIEKKLTGSHRETPAVDWRSLVRELAPLVLGIPVCRECGCTDVSPCEGGCEWVSADLCSACRDQLIGERKTIWVVFAGTEVAGVLPDEESALDVSLKFEDGRVAEVWAYAPTLGMRPPVPGGESDA